MAEKGGVLKSNCVVARCQNKQDICIINLNHEVNTRLTRWCRCQMWLGKLCLRCARAAHVARHSIQMSGMLLL